jgi:hypothetical protein
MLHEKKSLKRNLKIGRRTKMSNKRNPMMCLTMMVAILIGTCGHAKADFVFGDVETLPEPINTPGISSGDLTMTADGLEAYFLSIRPEGYGGEDIWVCRRHSKEDGWGPAVNLGPPVNTSACDGTPCISADGLELYFSDVGVSGSPYRSGGHGGGDIWIAKRNNRDDNWGNPVNLGSTINSSSIQRPG